MAGIKRQVRRALQYQNKQISNNAGHGLVAAGLSSEGYNGGYAEALRDVLLALNGVTPRNWSIWDKHLKAFESSPTVKAT